MNDGWKTGGIEVIGQAENRKTVFRLDTGAVVKGWCRGGICWPWPRRIGTRTEIVGAVVASLYDENGLVHTVGWGRCAAIGPTIGRDGIFERIGLSGLVRFGVAFDNCFRWACWSRSTDGYYNAVKMLRSRVGEIERCLRFRPLESVADVPEQADALIASFAEEGRLDVHPELADEIDKEDSSREGLRPYTEALAAGLWLIQEQKPAE